jgi:hypothetical protein
MPAHYIIYREHHKDNGTTEWKDLLSSLTRNERNHFLTIVRENQFDESVRSKFCKVNTLLEHYKKGKSEPLNNSW